MDDIFTVIMYSITHVVGGGSLEMSETPHLSTVQYINSLIEVAEAKGVFLEIGTDFTTFHNTIKNEGIRTAVAPVFDPDLSDVSPANGRCTNNRHSTVCL